MLPQWEYCLIYKRPEAGHYYAVFLPAADAQRIAGPAAKTEADEFNALIRYIGTLGNVGWEMVSSDATSYWFKRPKAVR